MKYGLLELLVDPALVESAVARSDAAATEAFRTYAAHSSLGPVMVKVVVDIGGKDYLPEVEISEASQLIYGRED
jgi:hypothetical protein